jgi:hypothetical protein
MGSFGGLEMLSKVKILQSLIPGGSGNQNVASLAPMTAIRSPMGPESLPAEADTSIAPVSGTNINLGFIKEFQGYLEGNGE